jgi:hypothetical protein
MIRTPVPFLEPFCDCFSSGFQLLVFPVFLLAQDCSPLTRVSAADAQIVNHGFRATPVTKHFIANCRLLATSDITAI